VVPELQRIRDGVQDRLSYAVHRTESLAELAKIISWYVAPTRGAYARFLRPHVGPSVSIRQHDGNQQIYRLTSCLRSTLEKFVFVLLLKIGPTWHTYASAPILLPTRRGP